MRSVERISAHSRRGLARPRPRGLKMPVAPLNENFLGLGRDVSLARQTFNRMIVDGPLKSQGIAVLDFDAEQRAGRVPLADGVHPTDDGYAGMSKLDVAFVDKALEKH